MLNASFNLHGEPIVYSPEDALTTFERSGLRHLALGHFLLSKTDPEAAPEVWPERDERARQSGAPVSELGAGRGA